MEIFVSKNGDDRNDGSKTAPFASIQGARDAIRKYAGNLPEARQKVRQPDLKAYGLTGEGNLLLDEIPNVRILDDGTIQLPPDSEIFRRIPDMPFQRGPLNGHSTGLQTREKSS